MIGLIMTLVLAGGADDGAIVTRAWALVNAKQPADAVAMVEPVIARFDAAAAKESRQTYCAMSGAQTIAYMALATSGKTGAVAVDRAYCDALFTKGFALIDLGRVAEAQAVYRRQIALAPMDAHVLSEYGQTLRMQRKWDEMLATCRQAESYAGLASDPAVQRTLALRCQGFALIEQGKWDEAEGKYRECLKIDPNDAKAKNELQYIAEQRGKPSV